MHKLFSQQPFIAVSASILIWLVLTVFFHLIGYPIVISVVLFLIFAHWIWVRHFSSSRILHLSLLLSLIIFSAHYLVLIYNFSPLIVPIPALIMLTVLLFKDLQLALTMSFVSSLIVTLILNQNMEFYLLHVVGGIASSFAIQNSRNRTQFLIAGFLISGAFILFQIFMHPYAAYYLSENFYTFQINPLLLNAFLSSFGVMVSLKIFEYLFGVITNYSLLELADFNHPLLKRMSLEAPGTYHHSIMVSNLSEFAADAIGADALLCRVGCYYHDIGKMIKPEYFTENQLIGINQHDQIEPSMSRLVILNHVKEGIEMAKKYKLNPAIIDFIAEHHGTSLMFYFYQKSLEMAEKGEEINEEDYRYPGPKPQSRETAITLMADSVEAATRSLDEPSPNKIEALVKKIVNNKFIDGQLDECDLTLKDINLISETFIRVLCATHHSRVKYPEKKNENDKGHPSPKQSEKAQAEPSADSENHSENS